MGNKFSELDTKKKMEHIWYYYKIHIIVSIIVVIVLVQSIISAANRKTPILSVDFVGTRITNEKLINLGNEATKFMTNKPKEEVDLNFLTYDKKGDPSMNSATQNKLTVTIAAGDLDVIIMDKDEFNSWMDEGYLLKLDDIKECADLSKYDLKVVKGKASKQGDSTEHNYGIEVDKVKAIKNLNYDSDNKVLGIISNTKRKDSAVKFIQWLISEN